VLRSHFGRQLGRAPRAVASLGIALALSALAGLDACADYLGDSPDYEIVEAGPPDPPDRDPPVSVDASPVDAGDGCPKGRGPQMIRAGATCVDRTEVTYGQYQEFIDDRAGDAGGQPPECVWNSSYLPYSGWPYTDGKQHHPVHDVTWCSAHAYCQWAGKRLCGAPDTGAPVAPKDIADASADEWFAACSRGGERVYPYGDSYRAEACNVGEPGEAGTPSPGYRDGSVPVGTMEDCEGGYAGIMDMSGNAEEWENACEATTAGDAGRSDVCLARGGGFGSPTNRLACAARNRLFRSNRAGIRCCATPEF
jgi:formylglycine-generating enzyme